jgi:hypothetical protein
MKQKVNMESQVPIVNNQLTLQVSNQQQEINLQPNGKTTKLVCNVQEARSTQQL